MPARMIGCLISKSRVTGVVIRDITGVLVVGGWLDVVDVDEMRCAAPLSATPPLRLLKRIPKRALDDLKV